MWCECSFFFKRVFLCVFWIIFLCFFFVIHFCQPCRGVLYILLRAYERVLFIIGFLRACECDGTSAFLRWFNGISMSIFESVWLSVALSVVMHKLKTKSHLQLNHRPNCITTKTIYSRHYCVCYHVKHTLMTHYYMYTQRSELNCQCAQIWIFYCWCWCYFVNNKTIKFLLCNLWDTIEPIILRVIC